MPEKSESGKMTAEKMARIMERKMDEDFQKRSKMHKDFRAGRIVHKREKENE